jgi:phosphosulfolactate synthase
MACWQVCNEGISRWKVAACKQYGVPTVTGGGPFGVAVQQGQLPLYLDLVADVGMTRIEAGEGFTTCRCRPSG